MGRDARNKWFNNKCVRKPAYNSPGASPPPSPPTVYRALNHDLWRPNPENSRKLVTTFTFMRLKPRFFAVLQEFLSAEGCGCLAEGLRFDCGQCGSFTVFAAVYLRFSAVVRQVRLEPRKCEKDITSRYWAGLCMLFSRGEFESVLRYEISWLACIGQWLVSYAASDASPYISAKRRLLITHTHSHLLLSCRLICDSRC